MLTGLGLTNSLHLPSSNSSQTQNMPLFKALLTYLNQNFAGGLSQETDSNDPASISDCDLFREIYQETMEDENLPNETYQNNLYSTFDIISNYDFLLPRRFISLLNQTGNFFNGFNEHRQLFLNSFDDSL